MKILDIPLSDVVDKLVIVGCLAAVGVFLRLNDPRRDAGSSNIPQASGTAGMDELWKDAVGDKASSLKFAPSIPGPALTRAVVQAPTVLKRPVPPAPEPEPIAQVSPQAAPAPKPVPRLKPVGYSFSSQASKATTSAFFAYPKTAPAAAPPAEAPAPAAAVPASSSGPSPAPKSDGGRFRHLYSR